MPPRSPLSSHCVFLDSASLVWLEEGMPDWKRKNEEGLRFSNEPPSQAKDAEIFRQLDGHGVAGPSQRWPPDTTPTSATSHGLPGPTHWRGHARQHYGFCLLCAYADSTPRPRSPSASFAKQIDAERCARV